MKVSRVFIIHFSILFLLAIDFFLVYFFRDVVFLRAAGFIFASLGVLNIFFALILKFSGKIVDDVSFRKGVRLKIVITIIIIIAISFCVLFLTPNEAP